MPDFYEFFAGGGMVRAGLGQGWRCAFANDVDPKKSRSYRENWGGAELTTADVGSLAASDLPGRADLAWASFPCQDLSLAGAGAGLKGNRSGTFWPFWRLMKGLIAEGRAPRLVTLENVCGTLNSHGGTDFVTICGEVWQAGYSLGAMVIDASRFVPQSRPRLFIVCVHQSVTVPDALILNGP
ncbi:MAG TPA: DNA (cytosine-5-)-methyltransferase, partial [Bryobacteraceae bacterium]|nr:DNA (cytosine-5-)-methyltransferase [Bryobacteraceae bacterium]